MLDLDSSLAEEYTRELGVLSKLRLSFGLIDKWPDWALEAHAMSGHLGAAPRTYEPSCTQVV